MISFRILNEKNIEAVAASLASLGDEEFTRGVLESFLEVGEDGAEVAVSEAGGALLVRIFDRGRYSFVYPIEVAELTDLDLALTELANYSVREMIPFYLTDTPREELERVRRIFAHFDARAYDEDEDSFVVIIYSECDMLDGAPEISENGVTLSEILDSDAEEYARLCRSTEVSLYWGYDYREDMPDADAPDFLRTVRGELALGIALALAVRLGGVDSPLIGEAVLYGFDYRRGASVAVRILPEFWGRGIGSRAFALAVKLAREIGVKTLRTEVMEENVASVAMTEKFLDRASVKEGRVFFSKNL